MSSVAVEHASYLSRCHSSPILTIFFARSVANLFCHLFKFQQDECAEWEAKGNKIKEKCPRGGVKFAIECLNSVLGSEMSENVIKSNWEIEKFI